MQQITLISTVHKEIGKCNADELCRIISKIAPQVIFLEALETTYSYYQKQNFNQFKVFHSKLELHAIQLYQQKSKFQYVPVLDVGLPDSFDKKLELVTRYPEHRHLTDSFNQTVYNEGLPFLNSHRAVQFQRQLRDIEEKILDDKELQHLVDKEIQVYENSMIANILKYCGQNQFEDAVFIFGVAHRASIVDKISDSKIQRKCMIRWMVELPV